MKRQQRLPVLAAYRHGTAERRSSLFEKVNGCGMQMRSPDNGGIKSSLGRSW
jgi:hypothetical protein